MIIPLILLTECLLFYWESRLLIFSKPLKGISRCLMKESSLLTGVCVCVCVCVCALGWDKCRAQIPNMGHHTLLYVTSLQESGPSGTKWNLSLLPYQLLHFQKSLYVNLTVLQKHFLSDFWADIVINDDAEQQYNYSVTLYFYPC